MNELIYGAVMLAIIYFILLVLSRPAPVEHGDWEDVEREDFEG
jgi:hypothetical protein